MKQENHPLLLDENYKRFLACRKAVSHRNVGLIIAYVDVTDDLVAGLVLSQIIYWFSPDRQGQPRVRVKKNNRYWLAKRRNDWRKECGISPKQYDRAISVLETKAFVEVKLFKFDGTPTPHITVNWEALTSQLEKMGAHRPECVEIDASTDTDGGKSHSPEENADFDQKLKSITKEYLSETSSENTNNTGVAVAHFREENKDNGPILQPPTLALTTPQCSHEDQKMLVQEFLVKWKERFPTQSVTDADVQAAEKVIGLGVCCYERGSVVTKFLNVVAEEKLPNIQVMLDRHGPYLEERKQIHQLTGIMPGKGGKLVALLTDWVMRFSNFNNRRYQFQEADLLAACDFVENDLGIDVNYVIETAEYAWEDAKGAKPVKGFDKHFFSRKAGKLSTFLKFYESIVQEVYA